MAQGYMTLQEASQFVGMTADDLKQMAQRNQIRSFQDRGTLRFRVQDIHELARQRGATSDLELPLADAPKTPRTPKSSIGSASSRGNKPKSSATFAFDVGPVDDETVDIGRDYPSEGPQSQKSKKKSGSDSDVRLVPDARGSISDIKLVGDGGVIQLMPDAPKSRVQRVSKLGAGPSSSRSKLGPASSSSQRPGLTPPPLRVDSGPRLVPLDTDSDIKIIGASSDEISLDSLPSATDSDIRLERFRPKSRLNVEPSMLTEEINLDEELQKSQPVPKAKIKAKPQTTFGGGISPFELSEHDATLPPDSGDSSDFDLVPTGEEEGQLLLESGDDFSLELPSEMVSLEENNPTLELGESSDFDLDLSLTPVEDAPAPAPVHMHGTESSEFELSLEDSAQPSNSFALGDSDSEFELTLESSESELAEASSESDSEFDLTLDDSSQLVMEDSENKDIFENDFDMPHLEDESGSQVVALDTEMEGSDFDIALGDGDFESSDETGSQVIALDEEDLEALEDDLPSPKKKGKQRGAAKLAQDDSEFSDFEQLDEYPATEEGEEAPEREVEVREVVRERLIRPAPWGVLPVALMLPCILVMVVVGLLGFEMVQSSQGYRPPGFLSKSLGDMFGMKMGVTK